MTQRLLPNWPTKILALLFLAAFIWTLVMFVRGDTDTLGNQTYGLILGAIPLFGGIYGLSLSKRWGHLKSAVGRAIFFLSLGLITWAAGTLIWVGYYNLYSDVEVPYPSLADLGYVVSLPLWAIGMVSLSKATGAKYGLKESTGKGVLLVVPLIVIVISYYLLVVIARGGIVSADPTDRLKLFFDLAYPIGDVVILTLATLVYGLSYKYFGGKFKAAIYIVLLGFIAMYIADFSFSYATTLETFYNGGWLDFLFVVAMFLLSWGVALFDMRNLRDDKKAEYAS